MTYHMVDMLSLIKTWNPIFTILLNLAPIGSVLQIKTKLVDTYEGIRRMAILYMQLRPKVAEIGDRLMINLSPEGANLGAKVIPGKEPSRSVRPVAISNRYTLGSSLK